MQELVFLNGKEPFTTSLIVAEGTGNEHKNVLEIIRKYEDKFSRWGKIEFTRLKRENPLGGRPTVVANLNEQQATFLITLLRNNAIVLDFKAELVDQFYKMREILLRRTTPSWVAVRQSSKDTNKDLMKAVHDEIIPSARKNGSTSPDRLFYMTYNKLINKNAGVKAGQRDNLPTTQLIMIDQMQSIAAAKIRSDSLQGKSYKEIYPGTKLAVEGYAQVALVAERFLLN